MAIIGVIEAELQASTKEESGGIGPLFKQTRIVGPFAVTEMAARTLRAMKKAGAESVAALFVGEHDLMAEQDDEEIAVDAALKLVEAEDLDDEAADFSAMLSHVHQDLECSISIEGSAEHEEGEPALAVLVTGVELEPEGAVGGRDATDGGGDATDAGPVDESDEPAVTALAPDYQSQMETLLERLRAELDKEVALLEPDVRVWEEETADLGGDVGRSSIPGIGPGI
jgi:hypothetical protein